MRHVARALTAALAVLAGQAAAQVGPPRLSANLVDPQRNARNQSIVVETRATGVEIVDPERARPAEGSREYADRQAGVRQAHYHYQLDDGPVIATTADRLSFHDVEPGEHTVTIRLADAEHQPVGAEQQLTIEIPER